MRLRPSGASGLLVSSFDAFHRYQQESAWTWEHQALVRARAVAGDVKLINRFNQLRKDVICQPRDNSLLRNDIVQMREKMREHLDKPKRAKTTLTETFNIKQSRGGIVDIEFLVQFSVLAYASTYPRLSDWTDNIRLLEVLSEVGVLSQQEAQQLTLAYQDYRAAAHLSALKQQKDISSVKTFTLYQQQVEKIWQRLLFKGSDSPSV